MTQRGHPEIEREFFLEIKAKRTGNHDGSDYCKALFDRRRLHT